MRKKKEFFAIESNFIVRSLDSNKESKINKFLLCEREICSIKLNSHFCVCSNNNSEHECECDTFLQCEINFPSSPKFLVSSMSRLMDNKILLFYFLGNSPSFEILH